jgi:hypothetical protein
MNLKITNQIIMIQTMLLQMLKFKHSIRQGKWLELMSETFMQTEA